VSAKASQPGERHVVPNDHGVEDFAPSDVKGGTFYQNGQMVYGTEGRL